ncbi:hypothetical protein NEUTE1DRAFT_110351 [Neurospora tetrasperma FGSC 2508]|uniref:Uncharacterized protein n=1 Tax=Neurospora tetrasperma (strain FGSC 2508 / ATCC MYA-4615 / P0657) TaxID=510951 RepID=F8MKD0_NEUT8|nr:uncharacterized protein NEUTE1DRAFT_110351 [Neurospora tetrasperma FGSC 2508]EGO58211.1 hypothetical protein NEUTE1DRAFT_110351 [Neurospora tetrasperma FGSC 2508]EGZ71473.1 hypothetical protein NEUTE2DRAFT_138665 [Neurospora tetrasperma FGSC 2509]
MPGLFAKHSTEMSTFSLPVSGSSTVGVALLYHSPLGKGPLIHAPSLSRLREFVGFRRPYREPRGEGDSSSSSTYSKRRAVIATMAPAHPVSAPTKQLNGKEEEQDSTAPDHSVAGVSFDVLGCLGNAKPRVDAFAVMETDPVVAKQPGGDVSLENRMRWHLATQACRRLGVAAPNRIADRLESSKRTRFTVVRRGPRRSRSPGLPYKFNKKFQKKAASLPRHLIHISPTVGKSLHFMHCNSARLTKTTSTDTTHTRLGLWQANKMSQGGRSRAWGFARAEGKWKVNPRYDFFIFSFFFHCDCRLPHDVGNGLSSRKFDKHVKGTWIQEQKCCQTPTPTLPTPLIASFLQNNVHFPRIPSVAVLLPFPRGYHKDIKP